MSETIRILLVDDHKVLRDGLRALIESEADLTVAGEASDGEEAIQQTVALQPDVVVLDLGLPDMSGLDVIERIRDQAADCRIVVLSMHSRRRFVRQAIEAGADGYIPKSSTHTSLLEAIRVVHAGERFLDPKAATVLVDSITQEQTERQQFEELSEREQEVLRLTAMGFTSREIGEQLFISPKTVETYRQRAMDKLSIDHRADLIKFAVRAGILDDLKR